MTRMCRFTILLGLLLLAPFALTGCPADVEPDPFQTALDDGWAAIRSRDLTKAETRFREALVLRPGEWEPLTGIGWARLHAGAAQEAIDQFNLAGNAAPLELDPPAGRVLAYSLLERRADVRTEGLGVLGKNPGYFLLGDPGYAASDVRWLVARAALDLGDYATVASQLDVLSPGHGLDPGTAAFPERALALLESLRTSV